MTAFDPRRWRLDAATGAAVEDLLRKIEARARRVDSRTAADARDVLRRLLPREHISAEELEGGGLLPGPLLANRYRIVNLLGRGGMGMLYRADDLKLSPAVALKFLSKAGLLVHVELAAPGASRLRPTQGRTHTWLKVQA